MAKEKIRGIYCIENLQNHKKYIGQSKDVFRRISNHKNLLRKHKHHNIYLQHAWDKYGEDCFHFYLLESCNELDIDKIERYYISMFDTTNDNNGYNLESGGNMGKHHSAKTIEKLLEIHSEEKVPVYCVELDKIYDGFVDVEKEFNISYSAIRRCCVEKRGTCCGYHWLYLSDKTEENIAKVLSDKDLCKKEVYCFELDKIFESEIEAERQTGAKHVGCCCKGLYGRNSSGKHPITNKPLHWCYVDEINTYQIRTKIRRNNKPRNNKKVVCIETQKVYESIDEAERILNIHHIGDVCKGNRKTAGGYTFRYAS